MNAIIKHALVNAGLTAVYALLIARGMFYMEERFGQNEPDTFLAPAVLLITFVASAAITGFLVFGRPVMWYWDGKKSEALKLLAYTVIFLLVIALFLVSIL